MRPIVKVNHPKIRIEEHLRSLKDAKIKLRQNYKVNPPEISLKLPENHI